MGTEGRRRPMFITKRAAIRLTLLLPGGGFITIVVSWAIAWNVNTTGRTTTMMFANGTQAVEFIPGEFQHGWPARSLARDDIPKPSVRPRFSISLGEKNLPWLPIWPGFAINTVFYAAILWLLFVAPRAWRRRRRIKRGLCPQCAYDLRGRPPAPGADAMACPECGAAASRTVMVGRP